MQKIGNRGLTFALLLTCAAILPGRAQTLPGGLTADDLQVGGYADFGRFQLGGDADGEILSRVGARWSIDKAINPNFAVMAKLNWMFWRNQATDIQLFHIAGLKFDADMQAALTWTPDLVQTTRLGLYDFKYNPDSRNLGEYLLRSEAYPTLLESSQGKDLLADSHNRVAGVEYSRREAPLFQHTALLYAEQFSQPVYDLTLAYLATFGTAKANVGFGAAWGRFVKLSHNDSNSTLPPDRYAYLRSTDLSTSALKFSLRGRADLFSVPAFFGPNPTQPFAIYGEAALLGVQSDTLYYKNVMERVPVMVGLSLPSGGLLTSLAVEYEYLNNPYYDRRYSVREGVTPLPVVDDYSAPLPNYTRDDRRWSVQAHKALNNWLDVKVRVASDHLRLRSWDGDYESGRPMTETTGDWYFLARVEFHN